MGHRRGHGVQWMPFRRERHRRVARLSTLRRRRRDHRASCVAHWL
jgi:hypothetical protein